MSSAIEAEATPFKTLIVDDHILYRDGLRKLIETWDDFVVVGEAGDGLECIEFCKNHTDLDLVLMDIQMPKMNGIEAAAALHHVFPDLAILMLTVSVEDDDVFGSLQNGACGYILKDISSKMLHTRMVDVMKGKGALSEAVTKKVIDCVAKNSCSKKTRDSLSVAADAAIVKASISQEDLDALKLVVKGASNEEIAAALYISVPSVKKRLSRYMRVFKVENRVQLAVLLSESGILS